MQLTKDNTLFFRLFCLKYPQREKYFKEYFDLIKSLSPFQVIDLYGLGDASPFNKFIYKSTAKASGMSSRLGCFDATLSHYKAIKIAYEKGYEYCVVMEDDLRFIKKDREYLICQTFQSIPDDASVVLFDAFWVTYNKSAPATKIKDTNLSFRRATHAESGAFYCLPRSAMAQIINRIEKAAPPAQIELFQNIDQFFDETKFQFKVYTVYPNLAVQQLDGHTSNCPYGHQLKTYNQMGISLDNYDEYTYTGSGSN